MKSNPNSSRKADTVSIAPNFRAIYHTLLEKAWLIVIAVLLSAVAGAVYVVRTPKVYAARSVIQVEQSERKVVNIQDVAQEDLRAVELVKTIEQNLTSNELLARVVKAHDLANDPRFLPPRASGKYSEDELIRALFRRVTAKLRRGTRLIDVSVESTSPELAQQLSQSMVKEFIRQSFEQRAGVSQVANEFLVQEANRLKAKLQESERALQSYRENNDAVSLEEKQNITVETLKDLNLKLTAARTERMKRESEFVQFKNSSASTAEELLAIPAIATAPDVLEVKSGISNKESEIAMLTQRYRSEHPKFIQAQSQLRELRASLERTIRKAGETLGAANESATVTERKIEAALREQEKLALELNKMAIPYNALVRDMESDRALYESVLTRLKETDVTKGIETNNVRIVDLARLPMAPIKPQKPLILTGSIVAGILLGIALCFALNAIDSSLKTVDDAERILGISAIAAVPNGSGKAKTAGKRESKSHPQPMMLEEPQSHVAEAFRSLRTSLALREGTGTQQTILFTSAVPAEGKSFCSVNCATSLAQQGLRTLIIDADLRRPTVGKVLCPNEQSPGLSDFLAKQCDLDIAIKDTGIENLSVLPAGTIAMKPAELLCATSLTRLFSESRLAEFDRIVVDTAPINAVSDALHIIKYVQVVCLVARSFSTPAGAVKRALRSLQDAGASEVGLVINRLPVRTGAGYYYYYSAGEYGQAGVYGAKAA